MSSFLLFFYVFCCISLYFTQKIALYDPKNSFFDNLNSGGMLKCIEYTESILPYHFIQGKQQNADITTYYQGEGQRSNQVLK